MLPAVSFSKPVVVAHRGASGYLPEHTLAAKAAAYFSGVDYIEQDVVLTKDSVPIVLHDIYVDSVTNVSKVYPKRKRTDGRYYAIDFSFQELLELKVTERFNPKTGKRYFKNRFPAYASRFHIHTLADEIELIEGLNKSSGKQVGIYVEIKHPQFHQKENKDITRIVYQVLKSKGYEKTAFQNGKPRVFIQCFDPETLKHLKFNIKTSMPLVQLIGDNSWGESKADYEKMLSKDGIKEVATYAGYAGLWIGHMFDKKLNPSPSLKLAKKANLKIHAYTMRDDQIPPPLKNFDELHRAVLLKAGVSGIFSDHPDKSSAWLKQNFNL
jgi:glycerophosphoryl diester phosphodiesterase